MVLILPGNAAAQSTFVNTTFVITDDVTNYDPSQIWVSFQGGFTNSYAPQVVGTTTLSSAQLSEGFQSFNLQSLLGPVDSMQYTVTGTTVTSSNVTPIAYFGATQQYTFSLNDFSGRVYVNYGATPLSAPPNPSAPGTSPYIVFEPTVLGETITGTVPTSSNMDLSYVDGISAAAGTALRDATSGTFQTATTFNPITTTANIVNEVAALVPSAAVITSTGTAGGTVLRVESSAADPSAYHGWSTLETTLETNKTQLNISSYSSPMTGQPTNLNNALFGYSGAAALTGQPAGFETAQGYTTTGTFVSDLSIGLTGTQVAALTAAGLDPTSTPGVVISGSGTVSGTFSIFITQAALNAGTGIYGNNPGSYVLVGNTAYNYAATGITNDLTGRIVGDLTAGMVFGWSNSTVNIANWAATTGTDLYGAFSGVTTVGQLSTGQYFYLISLAAQQGKLSDWIGSNIDPNSMDYDQYLAAVSEFTGAYSSGFTDRLQGLGAPGTFWYTNNPPADPLTGPPPTDFSDVGFIDFTIGNDGIAVPEPSQYGLGLVLALAGLIAWRRFSSRSKQANLTLQPDR